MDFERHDVATAELAVDGEIEQSKVPNATRDLKLLWSYSLKSWTTSLVAETPRR
jgi:hypothetical protein